jgi:hypothetical protein
MNTEGQKLDRTLKNIASDVPRTTRAVEGHSRATRKATDEWGRFEKAMRKVLVVSQGLFAVFRPALMIGLISQARSLAGGITALGAGIVALGQQVVGAIGSLGSLVPRLVDAGGAAAAALPLMVGMGTAMVTVKLATKDLSQALGGNKQALARLTPEAKEFVRTLKEWKPVMNTLRASAQGGIFGGLTDAMKELRPALPFVNRAIRDMSRTLGNLARQAAGRVGSRNFLLDFAEVSRTGNVTVGRLGRAAINLGDALRHVAVVAQPLTLWMGRLAEQWSKGILNAARNARETGRMESFFQRTQRSLTTIGHIARDFALSLRTIFSLGRSQGEGLWSGMERGAAAMRRFTESANGQARIFLWWERGRRAFDALWGTARNLLSVVVSLGRAARPLGENLTSGLETTTRRWADFMRSFGGQSRARAFFDSTRDTLAALGRVVRDLGRAFFNLGAGGQNGMADMLNRFDRAIPGIERFLEAMDRTFGRETLNTVEQIVRLFTNLGGVGSPLGLLLQGVNTILSGVNTLLDRLPILRSAFGGLAAALGGFLLIRRFTRMENALGRMVGRWVGIKAKVNETTAAVNALTGATETLAAVTAATGAGGALPTRVSPRGGGPMAGETVTPRGVILPAGVSGTAEGPVAAARRGGIRGLLSRGASRVGRIGRFGGGAAGIAASIAAPVALDAAANRGLISHRTAGIGAATIGGATTGAMLGSFIPGVGTVAGAAVGGGLGFATSGGVGAVSSLFHSGVSFNGGSLAERMAGRDAAAARMTGTLGAAQSVAQAQRQVAYVRTQLTYMDQIAAKSKQVGIGQDEINRQLDGQRSRYQRILQVNQQALRADRERRAEIARANAALREQAANRWGQSRGNQLVRQWGRAYDVYRKAGWSEGRTVGEINKEALAEMGRTKNPVLRRQIGEQLLAWEQEWGKKKPAFRKGYDDLKSGIVKSFGDTGTTVKVVNGKILDGSRKQWDAIVLAVGNRAEMARQKVTTAFTGIQQQAVGALTAMGYTPGLAKRLVLKGDATGTMPSLQMTAGTAGSPIAGPQSPQSKAAGFAAGGRIPGVGLRDSVPVGGVAAPGELVVNRHTERRVDKHLRRMGTSLGAQVFGEQKKHSDAASEHHGILPGLARGGRAAILAEANRISNLNSTYQYGGGHVTPAPAGPPWDCSASVSRLLQAAGYGIPTMDSTGFMGFGAPGPGWLSIYANPGHVYTTIGGRAWGTSTSRPSGGPGWFAGGPRPGFTVRHVPSLEGGGAGGGGGGGAGAGGGATNLAGALLGPVAGTTGGMRGLPGGLVLGSSLLFGATLRGNVNRQLRRRGGGAGAGAGGGGNVTGNQAIGRQMMLAHGWGAGQWPALQTLWQGESGWNEKAYNSSSGATGIPQSLPGSKMATHGADWKTNPRTQIAWGLDYIAGRYGTPSAALAAWQGRSPHWYGQGGRVPAWGGWHAAGGSFTANRPTLIGVGESGAERVSIRPAGRGGMHVNVTVHMGSFSGNGDLQAAIEREVGAAFANLSSQLDHYIGDDGGLD